MLTDHLHDSFIKEKKKKKYKYKYKIKVLVHTFFVYLRVYLEELFTEFIFVISFKNRKIKLYETYKMTPN